MVSPLLLLDTVYELKSAYYLSISNYKNILFSELLTPMLFEMVAMTHLTRCRHRNELLQPKMTTVFIVVKIHTNYEIKEKLFWTEAQFDIANISHLSLLRKKV